MRSLRIELVDLENTEILSEMKKILSLNQGNEPVFIDMDSNKIALGKGFQVNITPELVEKLESLLGSGSVNVEFKAIKKEVEEEKVNGFQQIEV